MKQTQQYEPFTEMTMPILESTDALAGTTPNLIEPRQFVNMTFKGAYKCLESTAGNPIELSMILYNNLNGIEQLMQMNNRRSPFDFEEDDVISAIEQSPFESLTLLSKKQLATTQTDKHGKTSAAKKSMTNVTSASIAYNADKREHAVIDKNTSRIIF